MMAETSKEIEFVVKHGEEPREQSDAVHRHKVEKSNTWFGRWLYSWDIDPRELSDEELCRKAVDFYNDTLAEGDQPRTFIRMGKAKEE